MVVTKVVKDTINVIETRVNEYLYALQAERQVQILNVQWAPNIYNNNQAAVMIVFDVLDFRT